MSTGDRDTDVQQEILALLSDIADSLRVLRRLAAVAIWFVVALIVAFVGILAVIYIRVLAFF